MLWAVVHHPIAGRPDSFQRRHFLKTTNIYQVTFFSAEGQSGNKIADRRRCKLGERHMTAIQKGDDQRRNWKPEVTLSEVGFIHTDVPSRGIPWTLIFSGNHASERAISGATQGKYFRD
uniref:Uncharacterized protein n=1 Tax=Arabidopsis thaliana TaxID=3702 RepID=Q0WMI4_ARATH|nr:hypothetical protein [Arabidopsis thaliana]